MKKLVTILTVVGLCVGLTASGAFAYSFGFGGKFELTDTDNSGFAETLNFNASQLTPGQSLIEAAEPDFDSVLVPSSYVVLSEFTLSETDYVSNESYSFVNNPYVDGFKVYNADDTLLLEADITLAPLSINGGTGSINANFGLNLTNIDIKVSGSPILDAFAPPLPGGAVNFTFNIARTGLGSMIESPNGGTGTYSATAAPVPEPGTVLLLGAGLLALVGFGRKRLQ